jgi:hypothetical protein
MGATPRWRERPRRGRLGWWAGTGIGLLLLAGAAPARGQVSFSASVDRNEVGLGETLTLTLSVSVPEEKKAKGPSQPNTGSLEVTGRSEQSGVAFSFSTGGNRDFRRNRLILLTLRPTKIGEVTIGPSTLVYDGKTYTSDPITVRVVKEPTKPKRPRRVSPFGVSPFPDDDDFFRSPFEDLLNQRQEVGENDVFLDAQMSPDVVIQGQQATLSVWVYTRLSTRVGAPRWPKLDGFFAMEREVDGHIGQKFINGEQYQVKLLAQKALFPLHAGEILIGPVQVEVELSSSPFVPPETRTLKSRTLKIQVMELPKEGQPKDFHSANVGRFTLAASVDATEVNLNQPVTYTLTVRGTGNLQQLRPPELPELDRFKRFDASVDVQVSKKGKEVRGAKVLEWVLVPLASGELTLPELSFDFFDPEENQYRTLKTEPLTVKVASSQEAGAGASGPSGREVNLLAGVFKPIRFESSLTGYGPPFYKSPWFMPLLIGPAAVYLLLVLGGLARGLLVADNPRARSRRAASRARARLRRAQGLAASGKAAEFFAEMKSALLDAAEARIGVPAQGLLLDELLERLARDGVGGETREGLVREIENCDFGRFAPVSSRGNEMQGSLERAVRVFKGLSVRRPPRETGARVA